MREEWSSQEECAVAREQAAALAARLEAQQAAAEQAAERTATATARVAEHEELQSAAAACEVRS